MAFVSFVDYTKIDRPYSSFLERTENTAIDTQSSGASAVSEGSGLGGSFSGGLVTGPNGSVEVQPVKSDGGLSDIWIKNFIRSENWRPKNIGFYIDGQSGYAEFSNVHVSGNVQALTGNVGGWIIGTNLLKSAQSGARIELNKGLNRISIFDSLNEVVVMGYLDGLAKNDGTGNWGASNYGFWAKAGDKLSIDGDGEYTSGDWIIQNDANYLIKDISGNIIIRLGTDTGEKGLFIYNTSAVQLAKFISDEIFVGNALESLKYSVAGGLEISDPVITDNLVVREPISAGDLVAVVAGGKIVKTNSYLDAGRNYGIATNSSSPANIISGGSGYTTGLKATTGGSGTGCTVYVTASGGIIVYPIVVVNFGSGYTNGEILTVATGGANATFSFDFENTSKVQKTGPYVTTGKTAGLYYAPSSSYGSEAITIENQTRDSVYDANLGVGQVYKGSMLFSSAVALFITSPGGAGTYGYQVNILSLPVAEGGLSTVSDTDTITISRVGSVATASSSTINTTYSAGMYAYISGANQAEYNGWHRLLTGSGNTSFTFAVSGAPATPATGTITTTYRYVKWHLVAGNLTTTGSAETFWKFSLPVSSAYPGLNNIYGSNGSLLYNYWENGGVMDAKYLVEFWASTAGQLNISYNSTSTYADGDLCLGGAITAGQDLAFRLYERGGAGGISGYYDAGPKSMALARSTTELMLGRYG